MSKILLWYALIPGIAVLRSDLAFVQLCSSLATIWSSTKVQKPKGKSKKEKPEGEQGVRKVEIIFKDQRMIYLHFKKDASDELLDVRLFSSYMPH